MVMLLVLHVLLLGAAASHAELSTAPANRQRRLEDTEKETSCASILLSSYTSDFQERMDPCSCRELRDGRYRVECKYDYCEHCVGSTCGVQETYHTYDTAGEEETTFLCVKYTSGLQEGTEVCFAFGTSTTSDDDSITEASSNLFCTVEIDGMSCAACQYETCSNGLTQPRVDCGADASVDLCSTTTDIALDSPLAMFRTDFSFASCFFDIGGTNEVATMTPEPSMSPQAAQSLASPGLSPPKPSPSPSIATIRPASSPGPTTARFAQINAILETTPNATPISLDMQTVAPGDNEPIVPTGSPTMLVQEVRSGGNTVPPTLASTDSDGGDDDSLFSNTQIDVPDEAPTASSSSFLAATAAGCLVPLLMLLQ